jgi:hypothetical protein
MSFELALRLTEIMLALAFIQQSIEHLTGSRSEKIIHGLRILFSVALLFGVAPSWAVIGLLALTIAHIYRFQGPYNGGSDRMSLLILFCLCAAHLLPDPKWKELAFGYLGLQLVLSYFISGWVKIVNAAWRSGQALRDVFLFSAYPVSENMRKMAELPKLLFIMSWAVMLFELLFPFVVLNQTLLFAALFVAAAFHLSNACFFGLNRFFWIWLAAYPSIIWLQGRLFDVGGF